MTHNQRQTETFAALRAAREAKKRLEADLTSTIRDKLASFYTGTGLSCTQVRVVMVDVSAMGEPEPRLLLDHVTVDVALQ